SHRCEVLLDRALQAIDRGIPQAALVGEAPQVHAGCVNHVTGLELPTAGNGCLSQRDRTEQVAFLLDRRSPFAPDCAGHPSTELQASVGGIHYRINVGFSDVPVLEDNFRLPAHPRGLRVLESAACASCRLWARFPLFAIFVLPRACLRAASRAFLASSRAARRALSFSCQGS